MRTKALFLLVTFLLNTLVGFACALHLEYESAKGPTHDHSVHTHDSASHEGTQGHDSHNHHSAHSHDSVNPKGREHNHDSHDHHSADQKTEHVSSMPNQPQADSAEDDSCCQDEVSKFYSLDKFAPHSEKTITKASVFDIIVCCYNPLAAQHLVKGYTKQIDNRQRPPNRDIRIAIQSFQI